MFTSTKASAGFLGRRRGLTTFRALWPELRLGLIELQDQTPLDWVKPHEDARVLRSAYLAANDRLLERGMA